MMIELPSQSMDSTAQADEENASLLRLHDGLPKNDVRVAIAVRRVRCTMFRVAFPTIAMLLLSMMYRPILLSESKEKRSAVALSHVRANLLLDRLVVSVLGSARVPFGRLGSCEAPTLEEGVVKTSCHAIDVVHVKSGVVTDNVVKLDVSGSGRNVSVSHWWASGKTKGTASYPYSLFQYGFLNWLRIERLERLGAWGNFRMKQLEDVVDYSYCMPLREVSPQGLQCEARCSCEHNSCECTRMVNPSLPPAVFPASIPISAPLYGTRTEDESGWTSPFTDRLDYLLEIGDRAFSDGKIIRPTRVDIIEPNIAPFAGILVAIVLTTLVVRWSNTMVASPKVFVIADSESRSRLQDCQDDFTVIPESRTWAPNLQLFKRELKPGEELTFNTRDGSFRLPTPRVVRGSLVVCGASSAVWAIRASEHMGIPVLGAVDVFSGKNLYEVIQQSLEPFSDDNMTRRIQQIRDMRKFSVRVIFYTWLISLAFLVAPSKLSTITMAGLLLTLPALGLWFPYAMPRMLCRRLHLRDLDGPGATILKLIPVAIGVSSLFWTESLTSVAIAAYIGGIGFGTVFFLLLFEELPGDWRGLDVASLCIVSAGSVRGYEDTMGIEEKTMFWFGSHPQDSTIPGLYTGHAFRAPSPLPGGIHQMTLCGTNETGSGEA